MKRFLLCCLIASATFSALADDAPDVAQMIRDNKAGVQEDAVPCCKSISEVFRDVPELTRKATNFGKSSPHFDFGHGLAPFLALKLPADARVLELRALGQLLGWVFGGDGIVHYVALEALFYDAAYQALPAEVLASSQAILAAGGARLMFTYVRVPKEATFVVLATDRKLNDTGGSGLIRYLSPVPANSGTKDFFNAKHAPYNGDGLMNYGPVGLVVLPNAN